MLLIAGTFTIAAERRDDFIAAAVEVARVTRGEDGCVFYAFTASLDDPTTMHVVEKWTSQEALTAHLATDHVNAFRAALAGIMRGGDVLKYEVASEGPVL